MSVEVNVSLRKKWNIVMLSNYNFHSFQSGFSLKMKLHTMSVEVNVSLRKKVEYCYFIKLQLSLFSEWFFTQNMLFFV